MGGSYNIEFVVDWPDNQSVDVDSYMKIYAGCKEIDNSSVSFGESLTGENLTEDLEGETSYWEIEGSEDFLNEEPSWQTIKTVSAFDHDRKFGVWYGLYDGPDDWTNEGVVAYVLVSNTGSKPIKVNGMTLEAGNQVSIDAASAVADVGYLDYDGPGSAIGVDGNPYATGPISTVPTPTPHTPTAGASIGELIIDITDVNNCALILASQEDCIECDDWISMGYSDFEMCVDDHCSALGVCCPPTPTPETITSRETPTQTPNTITSTPYTPTSECDGEIVVFDTCYNHDPSNVTHMVVHCVPTGHAEYPIDWNKTYHFGVAGELPPTSSYDVGGDVDVLCYYPWTVVSTVDDLLSMGIHDYTSPDPFAADATGWVHALDYAGGSNCDNCLCNHTAPCPSTNTSTWTPDADTPTPTATQDTPTPTPDTPTPNTPTPTPNTPDTPTDTPTIPVVDCDDQCDCSYRPTDGYGTRIYSGSWPNEYVENNACVQWESKCWLSQSDGYIGVPGSSVDWQECTDCSDEFQQNECSGIPPTATPDTPTDTEIPVGTDDCGQCWQRAYALWDCTEEDWLRYPETPIPGWGVPYAPSARDGKPVIGDSHYGLANYISEDDFPWIDCLNDDDSGNNPDLFTWRPDTDPGNNNVNYIELNGHKFCVWTVWASSMFLDDGSSYCSEVSTASREESPELMSSVGVGGATSNSVSYPLCNCDISGSDPTDPWNNITTKLLWHRRHLPYEMIPTTFGAGFTPLYWDYSASIADADFGGNGLYDDPAGGGTAGMPALHSNGGTSCCPTPTPDTPSYTPTPNTPTDTPTPDTPSYTPTPDTPTPDTPTPTNVTPTFTPDTPTPTSPTISPQPPDTPTPDTPTETPTEYNRYYKAEYCTNVSILCDESGLGTVWVYSRRIDAAIGDVYKMITGPTNDQCVMISEKWNFPWPPANVNLWEIHDYNYGPCGDGGCFDCWPETPTRTDTPDTPTYTPDTPTATPDTPTYTPDTPTDVTPTPTPDTPTYTPDTPTDVTPTYTPDTPTDVTPTYTPDTPTDVTPTFTPDTPTDVTPTFTPDTPTDVTPTFTPDTPTDVTPTFTPDTPTDVTPTFTPDTPTDVTPTFTPDTPTDVTPTYTPDTPTDVTPTPDTPTNTPTPDTPTDVTPTPTPDTPTFTPDTPTNTPTPDQIWWAEWCKTAVNDCGGDNDRTSPGNGVWVTYAPDSSLLSQGKVVVVSGVGPQTARQDLDPNGSCAVLIVNESWRSGGGIDTYPIVTFMSSECSTGGCHDCWPETPTITLTPDTPTATPDTPTETPQYTPTHTPDTPTYTPDTPTDVTPTPTPDTPTYTPDTPTDVTPTYTPDTPTDVTPTPTPDTPTATPDTPTATPDTPTATPDTPTATPTYSLTQTPQYEYYWVEWCETGYDCQEDNVRDYPDHGTWIIWNPADGQLPLKEVVKVADLDKCGVVMNAKPAWVTPDTTHSILAKFGQCSGGACYDCWPPTPTRTLTPDTPTYTPDTPTATPDTPTATPDTPTETPQYTPTETETPQFNYYWVGHCGFYGDGNNALPNCSSNSDIGNADVGVWVQTTHVLDVANKQVYKLQARASSGSWPEIYVGSCAGALVYSTNTPQGVDASAFADVVDATTYGACPAGCASCLPPTPTPDTPTYTPQYTPTITHTPTVPPTATYTPTPAYYWVQWCDADVVPAQGGRTADSCFEIPPNVSDYDNADFGIGMYFDPAQGCAAPWAYNAVIKYNVNGRCGVVKSSVGATFFGTNLAVCSDFTGGYGDCADGGCYDCWPPTPTVSYTATPDTPTYTPQYTPTHTETPTLYEKWYRGRVCIDSTTAVECDDTGQQIYFSHDALIPGCPQGFGNCGQTAADPPPVVKVQPAGGGEEVCVVVHQKYSYNPNQGNIGTLVNMSYDRCPDGGCYTCNGHEKTPTPTPFTPTPTPDTPTATPDTPTATPDTPTATPDTPTATPNTPSSTPDYTYWKAVPCAWYQQDGSIGWLDCGTLTAVTGSPTLNVRVDNNRHVASSILAGEVWAINAPNYNGVGGVICVVLKEEWESVPQDVHSWALETYYGTCSDAAPGGCVGCAYLTTPPSTPSSTTTPVTDTPSYTKTPQDQLPVWTLTKTPFTTSQTRTAETPTTVTFTATTPQPVYECHPLTCTETETPQIVPPPQTITTTLTVPGSVDGPHVYAWCCDMIDYAEHGCCVSHIILDPNNNELNGIFLPKSDATGKAGFVIKAEYASLKNGTYTGTGCFHIDPLMTEYDIAEPWAQGLASQDGISILTNMIADWGPDQIDTSAARCSYCHQSSGFHTKTVTPTPSSTPPPTPSYTATQFGEDIQPNYKGLPCWMTDDCNNCLSQPGEGENYIYFRWEGGNGTTLPGSNPGGENISYTLDGGTCISKVKAVSSADGIDSEAYKAVRIPWFRSVYTLSDPTPSSCAECTNVVTPSATPQISDLGMLFVRTCNTSDDDTNPLTMKKVFLVDSGVDINAFLAPASGNSTFQFLNYTDGCEPDNYCCMTVCKHDASLEGGATIYTYQANPALYVDLWNRVQSAEGHNGFKDFGDSVIGGTEADPISLVTELIRDQDVDYSAQNCGVCSGLGVDDPQPLFKWSGAISGTFSPKLNATDGEKFSDIVSDLVKLTPVGLMGEGASKVVKFEIGNNKAGGGSTQSELKIGWTGGNQQCNATNMNWEVTNYSETAESPWPNLPVQWWWSSNKWKENNMGWLIAGTPDPNDNVGGVWPWSFGDCIDKVSHKYGDSIFDATDMSIMSASDLRGSELVQNKRALWNSTGESTIDAEWRVRNIRNGKNTQKRWHHLKIQWPLTAPGWTYTFADRTGDSSLGGWIGDYHDIIAATAGQSMDYSYYGGLVEEGTHNFLWNIFNKGPGVLYVQRVEDNGGHKKTCLYYWPPGSYTTGERISNPGFGGTPVSSMGVNATMQSYCNNTQMNDRGVWPVAISSNNQHVASIQPPDYSGRVEFGPTHQEPGMYCLHHQFKLSANNGYNESTWEDTQMAQYGSFFQDISVIHCWEAPPPSSGSNTSGSVPSSQGS